MSAYRGIAYRPASAPGAWASAEAYAVEACLAPHGRDTHRNDACPGGVAAFLVVSSAGRWYATDFAGKVIPTVSTWPDPERQPWAKTREDAAVTGLARLRGHITKRLGRRT